MINNRVRSHTHTSARVILGINGKNRFKRKIPPGLWIRIRIHNSSWIRIRIKKRVPDPQKMNADPEPCLKGGMQIEMLYLRGGYGPVSLLAGCVPDLSFYGFPIDLGTSNST